MPWSLWVHDCLSIVYVDIHMAVATAVHAGLGSAYAAVQAS